MIMDSLFKYNAYKGYTYSNDDFNLLGSLITSPTSQAELKNKIDAEELIPK